LPAIWLIFDLRKYAKAISIVSVNYLLQLYILEDKKMEKNVALILKIFGMKIANSFKLE
jgi:hypothetical protein